MCLSFLLATKKICETIPAQSKSLREWVSFWFSSLIAKIFQNKNQLKWMRAEQWLKRLAQNIILNALLWVGTMFEKYSRWVLEFYGFSFVEFLKGLSTTCNSSISLWLNKLIQELERGVQAFQSVSWCFSFIFSLCSLNLQLNDKFKILGTVYIRTDWSHFAPESA